MSNAAKTVSANGAPDTAFAHASARQQDAIDGFMEISQSIFNGLVAYNKELTSFVAGRVVTDLDLQRRFFECRSVDELISLQSDFVENAVNQYAAEADRLTAIGARVVREDLNVIERKKSSGAARKKSA